MPPPTSVTPLTKESTVVRRGLPSKHAPGRADRSSTHSNCPVFAESTKGSPSVFHPRSSNVFSAGTSGGWQSSDRNGSLSGRAHRSMSCSWSYPRLLRLLTPSVRRCQFRRSDARSAAKWSALSAPGIRSQPFRSKMNLSWSLSSSGISSNRSASWRDQPTAGSRGGTSPVFAAARWAPRWFSRVLTRPRAGEAGEEESISRHLQVQPASRQRLAKTKIAARM